MHGRTKIRPRNKRCTQRRTRKRRTQRGGTPSSSPRKSQSKSSSPRKSQSKSSSSRKSQSKSPGSAKIRNDFIATRDFAYMMSRYFDEDELMDLRKVNKNFKIASEKRMRKLAEEIDYCIGCETGVDSDQAHRNPYTKEYWPNCCVGDR